MSRDHPRPRPAQLPQHERECQASSEAKVSSIKRDSTTGKALPCDNFLYELLQGRAERAGGLWADRSVLDKGTLAAAFIGLKRASHRQPDRRTAYRPPPLIKPAARLAREVPLIRGTAQFSPGIGQPFPGRRSSPGRRLPLLGPAGHGGVGARVIPRGPPHRLSAATISARRASCKSGPSYAGTYAPLRRFGAATIALNAATSR
jgi:hypothetical protein